MNYKDVLNDIHVEVNSPEEMSKVTDEFLIASIHKHLQTLSERSSVEDRVEIELEVDKNEYSFPEAVYEVKKVKHAQLQVGADKYPLEIIEMSRLLDIERRDTSWQGSGAPRIASIWLDANAPFLRVHPTPEEVLDDDEYPEEQTITLYAHILYHTHKLNNAYTGLTQSILFPPRYLQTIKWGVKADVYSYLKQYELAQEARRMFEVALLNNLTNRGIYHQTSITYK